MRRIPMKEALHRSTLVAAMLAGLSGCMSLAPQAEIPSVKVPQLSTRIDQATAVTSADKPVSLAAFIRDERLLALVERALENNADMKRAILNVERARAQYGIAHADRYPGIDAQGAQHAQDIEGGALTRQYNALVGMTAFELDLFGRVKNMSDQALESWAATRADQQAARTMLAGEVMSAWSNLMALHAKHRLAQRAWLTQLELARLTNAQLEAGALGVQPVIQRERALNDAAAVLAGLEEAIDQTHNALAILVNADLPEAWPGDPLGQVDVLFHPLPERIDSSILLSRPDIRAAEHRLEAARASIGAARAAFFPRITLTANAGVISNELSSLFSGGLGVWNFIPQVTLPIFQAGKLSSSLSLAQLQQESSIVDYEQGVRQAFKEAADALSARTSAQRRSTLGAHNALMAHQNLKLEQARMDAGLSSAIEALEAQSGYLAAQMQFVDAQRDDAQSRIAIYKAIGGA